jgi:Transposase DDE domain
VEPVFGQIKQARGFRRFSLRGLAKVKSEWALVCATHNVLLDEREKQRVQSVLVSVMDPALAGRALARACEIRAGLTFPPGHDQAKWNLFRQVENLLRAITPAMLLDGIGGKLDREPEVIDLDVLTDVLPATNLTKADARSSISEEMRFKFRAYLKRGARLGVDPEGLRASTRAHLAMLLGNVGEPEDLADIRRLIEADSIRFQRAQEARAKGGRSQDNTGYGFLYFEAVTMIGPAAADDVLVELVRTQQYEYVLAERLPELARKRTRQSGFGTDRIDFNRIWKSRDGERDQSFVEGRRTRFADAILEEIERIKKEREEATDKRGFDHRLKVWGGALAARRKEVGQVDLGAHGTSGTLGRLHKGGSSRESPRFRRSLEPRRSSANSGCSHSGVTILGIVQQSKPLAIREPSGNGIC